MKSTGKHTRSTSSHGDNGNVAMRRSSGRSHGMDVLLDDLAAIRQDLVALAAGGVESLTDSAKNTLQSAADVVKRAGEAVKERAEEAHEAMGEFAHRRPVTTILAGAGAGIVVFMLASRMWGRR